MKVNSHAPACFLTGLWIELPVFLGAMKMVKQILIMAAFAVAGTLQLTGCTGEAPDDQGAAAANSEEGDESLAEESENTESE